MGNLLLQPTTRLVGLSLIIFHAAFSTTQAKPVVTFTSPCSCEENHGVSRWAAKTDPSEPPPNNANIKSITPAQMCAWQGIGGGVTQRSHRLIAEENWFSVTGRIDKVRIEDDGDVHIEMKNVDGKPGGIVVELPLGPHWCEMRKTVFSWTDVRFPVSPGRSDKFALVQHPIVTVIGKAFYDIDHSGKDTRNNRRTYDPSLAVWEIHPVMRLAIGNVAPAPTSVAAAPAPPVSAPTPEIAAPPPVPSPPLVTFSPATAPEQFVTITQPVTVQIPHGTAVLQPGMRLPILSRDSQSVDVRYLDARYAIPLSSTDLR
jgi:hypothetical protein